MKKITKKIAAAALAGAISTTGALAADNDFRNGIDFSIGQSSFNDETGIAVGMDAKFEYRMLDTSNGDVYIGLGLGATFFDPGTVEDMTSDIGVAADFYPTIAYTFENVDLTVTALAGYTIGQIGEATYDGMTYGAGLSYKISDKYSIGVSHKITDADVTDFSDETVDFSRTMASLFVKF